MKKTNNMRELQIETERLISRGEKEPLFTMEGVCPIVHSLCGVLTVLSALLVSCGNRRCFLYISDLPEEVPYVLQTGFMVAGVFGLVSIYLYTISLSKELRVHSVVYYRTYISVLVISGVLSQGSLITFGVASDIDEACIACYLISSMVFVICNLGAVLNTQNCDMLSENFVRKMVIGFGIAVFTFVYCSLLFWGLNFDYAVIDNLYMVVSYALLFSHFVYLGLLNFDLRSAQSMKKAKNIPYFTTL